MNGLAKSSSAYTAIPIVISELAKSSNGEDFARGVYVVTRCTWNLSQLRKIGIQFNEFVWSKWHAYRSAKAISA